MLFGLEKAILEGIDMGEDRIVSLVPNKTDAEYAAELKERAIEAWKPLLALMQEANSKGFRMVVNAGMNELGQAFIHNLEVQKIYK